MEVTADYNTNRDRHLPRKIREGESELGPSENHRHGKVIMHVPNLVPSEETPEAAPHCEGNRLSRMSTAKSLSK